MLPHEFFRAAKHMIHSRVNNLEEHADEYKVQPILRLSVVKVDAEGNVTISDKQTFALCALAMTENDIDRVVSGLLQQVEAYVRNGSNWVIDDVDYFDLRITKFHSAPHVRGHGIFPLSQRLTRKQAVINVDNLGGRDCFKYAVLSVLHSNEIERNRQRKSMYQAWENELDFGGIQWPMTAAQLDRFHRQNPTIMVNVLQWLEQNETHPVQALCQPREALGKCNDC